MDNAADRKSIRRKEKAAKLADTQRREVIANVMSTSFGRQWIWDLLASCHIFATTFTTDPQQTAFQEGQRNVGLSLLADIMAYCPDQYIQAMREANERFLSLTPAPASEPQDGDDSNLDPED